MVLSNTINWVKSEFENFSYVKNKAKDKAKSKLWWDELARQIAPDVFNILKNKLEIDDYEVEVIVVGQNQGKTEGLPPANVFSFQKELMETTLENCVISICQTLSPIPTHQAQDIVDDAIYFNLENRKNYMDNNELRADNEYAKLDHRDLVKTVQVLHDNEENMFEGAYIITIWAADQAAMKTAKSKVKGILRKYSVLGEFPIKRMYEAFVTGQPYPDVWGGAKIKMFTKMSSVLSPTINPISPLSGTGKGIFVGHDIETGKTISVDFWSQEAPHALVVGSTGSGKTFFLLLLLIRLYLLGRKVMYLTTKRDDHTNYEAVAQYFPDGGIIDIGNKPGCHNINPLQFLRINENMSVEEAIDVYDSHKELFCAFIKTVLQDQYSPAADSLTDRVLNILYGSKGIKRDDPKNRKNFPYMRDFIKCLEDELPKLKWRRKDTCQTLLDKLDSFREDGKWGYINKDTDADFNLKFSIVNLIKVPDGLREAMNVLLTGLLSSQVSAADSKGLTIVIDEGEDFLKDKALADIPLKGATKWRSQNTQLIFTIHEFDDLETTKMSSIMMSNTFYKFIFGANMDDSIIPFVDKYMRLRKKQLEDLKKLNQGDCLIKIKDNFVKCHVDADDKSFELIKLAKGSKVTDVIEIPLSKFGFVIKDQYKQVVNEHKVIFEFMLEEDYSIQALSDAGYKKENPYPQRALDTGTILTWIHESIRNDDHILQQTVDHYTTVIQTMLYLEEKGFTDLKVHHRNNVDIEGIYNCQSYAFEYERDGSHSVEQIKEKFLRARETHDRVFIICMSTNKNRVIEAVEDPERMKKKLKPENMCTRGISLKALIDEITNKENEQPENVENNENEEKSDIENIENFTKSYEEFAAQIEEISQDGHAEQMENLGLD